MIKKNNILIAVGLSSMLLFTGCSTSNLFGVGYESSACETSKSNGFCGAPSSIYKYKSKIKQMQRDYLYSGYPDKLFFAISREGVIGVKRERDDKWQPYEGSQYQKEINRLLSLKTDTKLGSAVATTSKTVTSQITKDSSAADLSYEYRQKETILQTKTNVGRMIRDTGEYTKTWVAPYEDNKGDLVSAHELYIVIKDPKWTIGEKTPKKVIDSATPEEMANTNIYQKAPNKFTYNKKEQEILNSFLQGK